METVNWLNYIGQINLYLAVSIGFYWLILKKETFFQINRAFLLISSVLALLIPFWKLGIIQDLFITTQVSTVVASFSLDDVVISSIRAEAVSPFNFTHVLIAIYLLGLAFQSLHFLRAIVNLKKVLNQPSSSGAAFSFFHNIFVDKNQRSYDVIYAHEEVHSRHFHSFDVIWVELIGLICWFNPLVYLLKKEVRLLHEYIADAHVSKLTGTQAYAELLVATHFRIDKNILVNHFNNQSILKNRIMKLAQKKSNRVLLFKYAFAMPLFAAMLIFSAANATTEKILNTLDESLETSPLSNAIEKTFSATKTPPIETKNTEKSESDLLKKKDLETPLLSADGVNLDIKKDTVIFTAPEQNPEFPGGIDEMYKFIAANMTYPETALRANVEGRVFVKFVVKADGSIGNIEVLKGLGFGCDQEALRVINLMPKWKPGYQNGEKVNVYFTMPVVFKLDKDLSILKTESLPKEVLYVVNGKETSLQIVSALDQRKIDKINVLKDVSATDKYGDEGKNGVIEITLKK